MSNTNTTASVVSEATARPWSVSHYQKTTCEISGFHHIVELPQTAAVAYVSRADHAALIVKAVNSHEALVKALEEARVQIEYLDDKFTRTGTSAAVLTQIRAALAGAK